jgi:hypothetical protein
MLNCHKPCQPRQDPGNAIKRLAAIRQVIDFHKKPMAAHFLGKAINVLISKARQSCPPGSQQSYPQIFWISRKSPEKSGTWHAAPALGC